MCVRMHILPNLTEICCVSIWVYAELAGVCVCVCVCVGGWVGGVWVNV